MRLHRLIQTDTAYYWQLDRYTESGVPVFFAPVLIKCRWDKHETSSQRQDGIETITGTVNILPDRVLVVGSILLLADAEVVTELLPQQYQNPLLIPQAVVIKSQTITAELGKPQKTTYPPNYRSNNITIECTS